MFEELIYIIYLYLYLFDLGRPMLKRHTLTLRIKKTISKVKTFGSIPSFIRDSGVVRAPC